jgi:hypothetical protein
MNAAMVDFTSALYLGMRHASDSLRPGRGPNSRMASRLPLLPHGWRELLVKS